MRSRIAAIADTATPWGTGFCSLLMLTALASPAGAYDLPALNLGGTSFFDAAPPPTGPGFYGIQYLTYYGADRLTDAAGHKLPLPKQDLSLVALTTQFLYVAPATLFGVAHPGATVLLSGLAGAQVDDGLNRTVLNSTTGLGDTVFGAFLGFDPIMRADRPLLAQSVEFDVIAPTGRYSRSTAITPGSNFVSLNPFYAATLWLTPAWTVSGRFHYLWNATNDAPKAALGPTALSSQAGQAVHLNVAMHYRLGDRWGVGVNAYYLQQLTDTRINGSAVAGRRERVFAVGPGITYNLTRDYSLFANGYREFGAQNRPEGARVVLRFNAHF